MHDKIMDNGLMAADLKSMEGKLYLLILLQLYHNGNKVILSRNH